MRPKVSVIIPIYGVESYIERCARSLFNQTLDDIEYIFVDDCSPDNSVKILREVLCEYPERESQTKIVRTPINSGLPAARRYGLQFISGDYVIHCDSDDWVDIKMYESMYNATVDGRYDVVVCNLTITNGDAYQQEVIDNIPEDKYDLIKYVLLGKVHGSLCNKLISRKLYRDNITFPRDNMREDLSLVVQLLYNSTHVSCVPQSYYRYYFNPNSISKKDTTTAVLNRFHQSMNNYRLIRDFFLKEGCGTQYKHELAALYFYIKFELINILDTQIGKEIWNSTLDLSICDILFLKIPLHFKIRYILIELGVYSLLKKLKISVRNFRD